MATRQKDPTPPPALADGLDNTDIVVDEPIIEGDETTAAAPAVVVDPGVESLKEQLAAERARRETAEAEAAAARAERAKDQVVLTDSRLLVIESTIQTKETEKAAIMRRLRDAKEAGDYEAEVTAQAELSEVTLDLKQAKLGKDRLENEVEEAKTKKDELPADPFDRFIKVNNIHPRSEQWLRNHMDYLTDPEKNAELTLAHQRALKAGAALNTDAYFSKIEAELGMGDAPPEEPERQDRQQAAPAAPVGRGGQMDASRKASPIPGITVMGPGKYRVTKEIAEAAQMSGVTVKQYVEEALKLQRGSDGQLH